MKVNERSGCFSPVNNDCSDNSEHKKHQRAYYDEYNSLEFSTIQIGIVARFIVGFFTLGISEAIIQCIQYYRTKRINNLGPKVISGSAWHEGNSKGRPRDNEQYKQNQEENLLKKKRAGGSRRIRHVPGTRGRPLGSNASNVPSRYSMSRNGYTSRYWI